MQRHRLQTAWLMTFHSEAKMNSAENLIKIKAIVKEIELLMSNANPIDKKALFEPYTRLYAEVGQGVIEADRLGNL